MAVVVYSPIDNVGEVTDVAALSVDDTGAVAHTITVGKRGVMFMNTGSSACWLGGSTVDPGNSRGIKLLADSLFTIRNTTNEFKVYFKCAAGVTTTISVAEYA